MKVPSLALARLGIVLLAASLRLPPLAAADRPRTILVVDNSGGNDVTLIDTATNKVIGSIETGPAAHGLAASPDGTRLYVSSEGEDRLLAFDLTTATLLWDRPVSGRANEISVSADGRFVYVPIRGADFVEVIDTELRRSIKNIPVGPRPHNTYRSSNGKWIYATSMGGASVAIIDIATQSVIGTIPLGGEPRPAASSPDDQFLYVELTGVHGFVIADVAARKVIQRIELPPADVAQVSAYGYTPSHGIAVRPGNKQLWITDVYGGNVEAFAVPGYAPLGKVKVGTAPDWLEFSPDGRTLYAGDSGSSDVAVVDVEHMRLTAKIPVGLGPKRILIVEVPRGMGGPGEPGWDRAAARPTNTDYYLKGGGMVSCQTESFRDQFQSGKLTAESAPALYRKLGIRGLELDARYVRSWDTAALDRILAAVHREQRILTALNGAGNLVSADAEANQRQIEEYRKLIRAARYLGTPVVVLSLGQTGEGDAADAGVGVERSIWALRQLLPVARELGVRLTIENGPGPARTADRLLKIVQSTDPVWVGACFNFRRWEDANTMRAAVDKLGSYVFHTHVTCAAFDRFGYESAIDYTYALPALARGAYGTTLSVAFDGQGDPTDSVEKMRDLLVKLWIGRGIAARPMAVAGK